jgi:hypothetical protein
VGLRRPCRGRTCGGMLGVMARIAPERPATRPTTTFGRDFCFLRVFYRFSKSGPGELLCVSHHHQAPEARIIFLAQQQIMLNPSLWCSGFCSQLRAPHRGTSLSSCVREAEWHFMYTIQGLSQICEKGCLRRQRQWRQWLRRRRRQEVALGRGRKLRRNRAPRKHKKRLLSCCKKRKRM